MDDDPEDVPVLVREELGLTPGVPVPAPHHHLLLAHPEQPDLVGRSENKAGGEERAASSVASIHQDGTHGRPLPELRLVEVGVQLGDGLKVTFFIVSETFDLSNISSLKTPYITYLPHRGTKSSGISGLGGSHTSTASVSSVSSVDPVYRVTTEANFGSIPTCWQGLFFTVGLNVIEVPSVSDITLRLQYSSSSASDLISLSRSKIAVRTVLHFSLISVVPGLVTAGFILTVIVSPESVVSSQDTPGSSLFRESLYSSSFRIMRSFSFVQFTLLSSVTSGRSLLVLGPQQT